MTSADTQGGRQDFGRCLGWGMDWNPKDLDPDMECCRVWFLKNPDEDEIWFDTCPIVDGFVDRDTIPVITIRRVVLERRQGPPLCFSLPEAMPWLHWYVDPWGRILSGETLQNSDVPLLGHALGIFVDGFQFVVDKYPECSAHSLFDNDQCLEGGCFPKPKHVCVEDGRRKIWSIYQGAVCKFDPTNADNADSKPG